MIKPTRATTRKGVLTWLARFNPWMNKDVKQAFYTDESLVAVWINKHSGAIHSYELADGRIIRSMLAHQRQAA